ncbi:MAG: AbrB/MazE/SpoVT family DNA-binding domain-containing protein [Treponema sp.]|nr:AbrB/MazE/SpoVT family DNA-binding domain-containing protein [Treponema sp.]
MEVARVTSKGQITIPRDIREKMNIKKGDKILFFEDNGKYFLQNSNLIALSDFQKAMKGTAKEAGFKNPDDVMKYIKELRREMNN